MQKIYALRLISFLLITCFFVGCKDEEAKQKEKFTTHFEKTKGTETPTYQEVIDFYIELSKHSPEINMQTMGATDSGIPLHIVTYNEDGEFNFNKAREKKTILLINNGIHPGEPDGIDATMLLFRDLALKKIKPPKHTIIVAIPIYNIGGALNRNSHTRANQNGPKEYGFRGNARNYDLNRDFIKADTKNARSFAEIYHLVQPDVFIDTHVSNGADYQYTLTHLFTQHNKLGGELGNYLQNKFMPAIEESLKNKDWDVTPYVNVFNAVPEKGFSQFIDYPRYSTGYTALWNTLGLMVETHMLKPYKQRVEGTYAILQAAIDVAENEHITIKSARKDAFEYYANITQYPLQWEIDTTQITTLNFKGYEATLDTSKVTGLMRLKYHQDKPFTKEVTYKNFLKPTHSVTVPEAYIIPKNWWNIIPLLEQNKIIMQPLEADTTLLVESYKIESYETYSRPYEGHYPHFNTKVSKTLKKVQFKKGDLYISTQQKGIRYLLETLEPEAVDSFFNWNFFDTILQQKEGFSPYVFEDIAANLLVENDSLQSAFKNLKETDENFANNWFAQLSWIYKNSPYYEPAHLQYPVYRVLKGNPN